MRWLGRREEEPMVGDKISNYIWIFDEADSNSITKI